MRSFQLEEGYNGFEAAGLQAEPAEQAAARLKLFEDSGIFGATKFSRAAETLEQVWPLSDDSIDGQRTVLLELAQSAIKKEKDAARLRSDLAAFEQRALTLGLSTAEVSETYKQAGRLLQPCESAPSSAQDRLNMALQIIHQAAQPTSIDQGKHGTCNVAALEVRIYSRMPSKAAQLVADFATSGRFITKDGTLVTLHTDSYLPDDESKHQPARDAERSMASQIFQIAAANVHWFRAEHDFWGNPVPKGTIGFAQIQGLRGSKYDQDGQRIFDAGERLINVNLNPPAAVLANPGIRVRHLFGINEQITGGAESGFIIENSVYGATDTIHVSSPKELHAALLGVKAAGNLPALLRVHTANEPFHRRPGNWHFINVVDVPADSDKVQISNQVGKASDRPVSIEDLYKATLIPDGNAIRPDDLQQWHPILGNPPTPSTIPRR